MLTTCPTCRQSYVGKSCPRCAPKSPRTAQRAAAPWDNPLTPGHWSQNPWIRCAVGIAVSQALFLGVRRWAEAAVSFFGPGEVYLSWSGHEGFAAWTLLQALCVLLGSMLAGAGQREWLFYGLTVGLINTIFDLAIGGAIFAKTEPWLILALLAVSILAGIAGSWLGAQFWKPLESYRPTLELGGGSKRGGIAVKDFFVGLNLISIKVNWVRIIIGSAVGIAGPPAASWLFYRGVAVLGMSSALEASINAQPGVFIFVIRVLTVILGGFIAGTNASNGPAHGFWSGLFCAIGMVVVRYVASQQPLGLPFVPQDVGRDAVITMVLCLFSAIFGAKLLPPVLHTGKKRKRSKMAEI